MRANELLLPGIVGAFALVIAYFYVLASSQKATTQMQQLTASATNSSNFQIPGMPNASALSILSPVIK